ncbi:MAG: hypothetical protein ACM31C_16005 [Acidobacteriota bacterium]
MGCGSSRITAVSAGPAGHELHPVAHATLCVTKGAIANASIAEPTVRAFALGTSGDAAQLAFTYSGESRAYRALESGELRKQVGLKLRAQDSCNVVYVMWRIAPKPGLAVQVKYNPGKARHEECGTEGYIKVKPSSHAAIPELSVGTSHTLRAEIHGDELRAWIDGALVWQGTLPEEARQIAGPAGLRTDNVSLEGLELHASRSPTPGLQCKQHETDD